MNCPIARAGQLARKQYDTDELSDCIKEECAWWQSELQNCIVYQAGMEIGTLCLFLEDIKNKMPHEEQFRK